MLGLVVTFAKLCVSNFFVADIGRTLAHICDLDHVLKTINEESVGVRDRPFQHPDLSNARSS
jgi:hypothetical protein